MPHATSLPPIGPSVTSGFDAASRLWWNLVDPPVNPMSCLEPPRGYTRPVNGTAVGALIAGLVGALVAVAISPILGLGLGIAAVALGVGGLGIAESRVRDAGRTMAMAGLVRGGAAIGAGAVALLASAAV
jgi:hypothetical protein